MINRRYNIKKKAATSQLIGLRDFVKYRTDKERIINNPFEENWKKAIAFQELLELYKPQPGDYAPNPNPNYDRRAFESFHRLKPKREEEDSAWEVNEDSQLKKFYRMAEGISHYEEAFEDHKILKTAAKIDTRSKSRKQIESREETPKTEKKKREQTTSKYKRIFFEKENLRQFQAFMDFREQQRKSFAHFKEEIERLHRKAVDQYGVAFERPQETVPTKSMDFEQYKGREAAIFERFIGDQPIENRALRKALQQTADASTVPLSLLKEAQRPNTSHPKGRFLFRENRQKLPKKKYFRISD